MREIGEIDMAKEILDIVDDNGQPTGEVIDRVTAGEDERQQIAGASAEAE